MSIWIKNRSPFINSWYSMIPFRKNISPSLYLALCLSLFSPSSLSLSFPPSLPPPPFPLCMCLKVLNLVLFTRLTGTWDWQAERSTCEAEGRLTWYIAVSTSSGNLRMENLGVILLEETRFLVMADRKLCTTLRSEKGTFYLG